MRALRFHGPGDLRLENDINEPLCGKDQVKIQPSFVGICGTDLHEYSSPTFIPSKEKPHPVTGESRPVTIGHEISGIVVEIGSEVNPDFISLGDKVAVQSTICCFNCGGGGMSDFLCVNSKFVHKLPPGIGLDIGALVEPLATSWRAVTESGIRPGDHVLIFGAGPLGLGVIQCCKARGAKKIIVAEVSSRRQMLAREFGATHVVDTNEEDIVKVARDLSDDGQGPQISIDCAGLAVTLKSACLATRPRGIVVNVAIWEKAVEFNPNLLVFGERRYHSVLGYSREDFQGVIRAIEARLLTPQAMITRTISIDRVVEDGFSALIQHKDREVKIQIDMSK
ncbi:hypothetical protein B0A52_06606 [Exophiala mesophila]|uniref:Enoyl reductase (ER) domain-containing protein n=1 Tax=Exophiala mesophila TaxID=212818 RepID=A0A438N1H6_EXOME|nr:hypothetical protein B0A52_06606 [Exophiala mesophila]